MRAVASALAAALFAAPAGADPVAARVEGMKAMEGATKALGALRLGLLPFTPELVRRAAATLVEETAQARRLYAAPVLGGALPLVWEDPEGWARALQAMAAAAEGLARAAEDREAALRAAEAVGAACSDCHGRFRRR